MNQRKNTYNPAVDALRVLSILAVLFIHTTTRTIGQTGNDVKDFPWTLFLNQVSRFAVPMFFMISGFVLELSYSHTGNYLEYLKKRLSKILVPYIFWSAIYYVFIYKVHTISYSQSLLTGSASYQLYFIPTLLIFYIVFPLIHLVFGILKKPVIMIILGLIQIVLLYKVYFISPLPYFYPISIAVLNFYVFLAGIYAFHHQQEILLFVKKLKYIVPIIVTALALYVFYESKSRYLLTYDYQTFYTQWRPSILLYTLSLGALLYAWLYKKVRYSALIKMLAKLSFFVFFIHIIVLELVWYPLGDYLFKQTQNQILHQLWFDPLYFLIVASISFTIAYIVHRLPYISRLTG